MTHHHDSRFFERPLCLALTGLVAFLLLAGVSSAPLRAAVVPDDFTDALVVSGFSQPVGFAFLPDGRALVIEQNTANIRLVVGGAIGTVDPLITVPGVNSSGNERGLLGIDVDAGWPARPYVYIYYNHSGSATNYISMYEASGDLDDPMSSDLQIVPASLYHLVTDIPDGNSNHNGGTVRSGPDGMIYVSLGDDYQECAAQQTGELLGKVLRLDPSNMPGTGSGPPPKADITPADNPFVTSLDPDARLVWCYGLRNPFRFSVDPLTGDLFIADVGLGSYEEMNQASGGENFGWPFREGPLVRTPGGCSEPGGPGGSSYDGPIAWYDRSGFTASIVSGGLYRQAAWPLDDSFPPAYEGDCFYVEYYQGWMRRLTWDGSQWVQAAPVPGQPSADNWAEGLSYASDFLVGPDGALWYLLQFGSSGGELRRIAYTGASGTVGALLDCAPSSGTVPFNTVISASLVNTYQEQHRRVSARLHVTLGNGSSYLNWRAGYTNIAAGGTSVTSWNQTIPALAAVLGTNSFQLQAEDVSPYPYNQPPYPPAGDTASAACQVLAVAP